MAASNTRVPKKYKEAPARRRLLGFRLAPLVFVVLALFALDYWAAARAVQSTPRVRVSYSPFFLEQVRAGHVRAITSRWGA